MKKEEYYSRLEKAVNFVEANLANNISLSAVSESAFSSLSHFHRIFFFMTGLTLKEYIRKRRLSQAAIELVTTDKKIIEIALEAQFENPESFNKSFKNMFSIAPREFRMQKPEFHVMRKIEFHPEDHSKLPDNMTLAFVFLSEQIVAGATTRTTLAGRQQTKDIPHFFQTVMQKQLLANMPSVIDANQMVGVYSDMTDEEEFDYTVGLFVKEWVNSKSLQCHRLPAAEYARFTVQGEDLEAAWRYIYGSWMPNSGRSRQKGLDFEIYFGNKTDIYIPMSPQK